MLSKLANKLIEKTKPPLSAWLVLTAFLAGLFPAGCATTRWAPIEPGAYVVDFSTGADEVTLRAIQQMQVVQDKGVVVFTLADGSEVVASFVGRDRAEWPAGCPAMRGSTRMEVLDLAREELAVGSITLSNPILVRGCPPDPVHVVLREDGDIGGGGGACNRPSECIYFLPKGELPWRANDVTASTDQDSPVTIDIIAGADEEYNRIDAATFTVTSGPQNGTVVDNLELAGTITEESDFDAAGTFIIRIVGLVTYTPNSGFDGTDAFTYRICDMDGYCDTARVTVTVDALDGG